MKKAHVDSYRPQIETSSLYLGPNKYADVPTDVRIARFKQSGDAHLVATYYKFGRYLLVCSSQPGGQAATLQGIWNDKLLPSWDSKYTTNINLEMNYWPAEVTNLAALNEPLFRLIREVSETVPKRPALCTALRAGCCTITPIFGVLRVPSTMGRPVCGCRVVHGYAAICGSITSTQAIKSFCAKYIRL